MADNPVERAAKKVQKRRVKALEVVDEGPPEPPTAASPRDEPAWSSPRRPHYTLGAVLGAALIVASVTGIVLNVTLPWLQSDFSNQPGVPAGTFQAQELDRGDLSGPGGFDYIDRLVDWPMIAFGLMIAAGVALVVIDLLPILRHGSHRSIRLAAGTLAAYGAFVLALTGFRWLGYQFESLAQPGDPVITLLAVPYINLGLGVLALAGVIYVGLGDLRYLTQNLDAGRFAGTAVRAPAWTMAIAASALLIAPLVPYVAFESPRGDAYAFEHSLALIAQFDDAGDNGGDAGRDLGWVRLMLWITIYVSVAALAFALMERSGRDFLTWGTLAQAYALNAIALVAGLVFIVLSYVHLADLESGTISFNHFLPLAYVALAFVMVPWFASVFRMYLANATTAASAAPEPPAS